MDARATAIRLIIGLIWVAILLLNRSNPTTATTAPTLFPPEIYDDATTAISGPDARAGSDAGVNRPRLDLYGNQTESAIGDYRIDVRGDVYEHHDPDTAVTELAPPGV